MARRSKGRIYKRDKRGKTIPRTQWKSRSGTYWLQYYVNGKDVRQSLKTSRLDDAERDRNRIVKPLEAGDKADKLRTLVSQLRDAEEDRAAGFIASTDVPIEDTWDFFVASNGSGRAPSTLSSLQSSWSIFLNWLKVHRQDIHTVAAIDRRAVLAYAEHLNSQPISPRTFNRHRHALSQIGRKVLLKAGIDAVDPWKFVESKPLDTISRKDLSHEQVMALFAKLADAKYDLPNRAEWEVVFHLGMFAGLRLGDCVLLTWDCVDLDTATLSLIPVKTKRQLKRVNIPIHPELSRKLTCAALWRQNDYIVPNLAERYQQIRTGVQKDAVRVFRDIGLQTSVKVEGRSVKSSQYGFHSLRHSFVSFCANAGVPLATVQSIVGHGSPAMTRHYTHISRESAEKAIYALPIGVCHDKRQADDENPINVAIQLLEGADASSWETNICDTLTILKRIAN